MAAAAIREPHRQRVVALEARVPHQGTGAVQEQHLLDDHEPADEEPHATGRERRERRHEIRQHVRCGRSASRAHGVDEAARPDLHELVLRSAWSSVRQPDPMAIAAIASAVRTHDD
jgi:hypothetical protein